MGRIARPFNDSVRNFSTWATAQQKLIHMLPDGKWIGLGAQKLQKQVSVISARRTCWVNDPHDVMFDVFERHFLTSIERKSLNYLASSLHCY